MNGMSQLHVWFTLKRTHWEIPTRKEIKFLEKVESQKCLLQFHWLILLLASNSSVVGSMAELNFIQWRSKIAEKSFPVQLAAP